MFNFTESQRSADERLRRESHRHRRSDTGQSRLHPEVLEELRLLILGFDRPPLVAVRRHLADWCTRRGLRPPSRASLYNTLPRIQGHVYSVARLPPHVQATLYNLPRDGDVPGHQLAFHCFNYGSLAAVSYAAGLPWLDLYQADHLRGWRPRSRGLLHAVLRARGIR